MTAPQTAKFETDRSACSTPGHCHQGVGLLKGKLLSKNTINHFKRASVGALAGAGLLAGLMAGGSAPANAYAPEEARVGIVDGHQAWRYGGYSTAAECQRDVAAERAAWRDSRVPYPTSKFGWCYRERNGKWYMLQATRSIA